jgi:hypothetical protein
MPSDIFYLTLIFHYYVISVKLPWHETWTDASNGKKTRVSCGWCKTEWVKNGVVAQAESISRF